MSSINLNNVRLVVIRFAFSNSDLVPFCLKTTTSFSKKSSSAEATGELKIEPVKDVGCLSLVDDLVANNYILVDAEAELHVGKNHNQYSVVKFVFAKAAGARRSRSFERICEVAQLELETLLSQAMWRVRVFLNSLFVDDVIILDEQAISINLEGRTPLFRPDGSPEIRRHKDEYGNKIGEPYRLEPKKFLMIRDDHLSVAEPVMV